MASRTPRSGAGSVAWFAAVLIALDLTLGTALVALNFAERHQFSGSEPSANAAMTNAAVQAVLLALALTALVWRTPKAAWLRSAGVGVGLAAASLIAVGANLRWAAY